MSGGFSGVVEVLFFSFLFGKIVKEDAYARMCT